MHIHHRDLDHISGSSLNGTVHGVALAVTTQGPVARIDVAEVAPPPHQGGDVAIFAGLLHHFGHVALQPVVGFKVVFDEFSGFLAGDVEFLAETIAARAVHDGEIDRFGLIAMQAGDFIVRDIENERGGGSVNVLLILKGLQHVLFTADLGNEAQLNLRIIRCQKDVVFVAGNKCFTYPRTLFCPDRDILNVRIAAAQPPGGYQSLVEGGMNASAARVDQFGQRIDVGRAQFGQPPVAQDLVDDRILGREFRQFFLTGAVLSTLGAPPAVGDL